MITLTSTFFLVEIVVGYVTNSMALVADSFHMLSDVVSLLVGYFALRYSAKRQENNGRFTFGWARSEVLGALVNAVFLFALCFSILVEAFKRMAVPEHLDNPKLVLITGGIGLFVNIIGLMLFHEHGHGHSHGGHGHSHAHGHSHSDGCKDHEKIENKQKNKPCNGDAKNNAAKEKEISIISDNTVSQPLIKEDEKCKESQLIEIKAVKGGDKKKEVSASQLNIRGVYLHVLGDALGSVIVMISALIVIYCQHNWTQFVDPSMSIILVLIILKTSIPLLKESSMILMQTVPMHINIKTIEDRMIEKIPEVSSVHEFHIWQLAGNRIIASAHVRCKSIQNYFMMAHQLKEFFHDEGIHSTTIQPEFDLEVLSDESKGLLKNMESCLFECENKCAEKTCCGNIISKKVSVESKEIIEYDEIKKMPT